jgi:glycosyltransferase involved in cell wall biosynthesis
MTSNKRDHSFSSLTITGFDILWDFVSIRYSWNIMNVSIVTITFNDHLGLVETGKSLGNSQVEWIVVDGSSDAQIASKNVAFLNAFDCILIQEKDQGRFDAMNKGLEIANGEIILFLNGGDKFAHSRVPKEISEKFEQTGCLWAVGQTQAVNLSGATSWFWPMPRHNSLKLKTGVNSYCHQATAYKTSIVRQLGGFKVDSLYSDWQFSLVLSAFSPPLIVDKLWTLFLTDGVSSQQSIEYWRKESHKLRRETGLLIGKHWVFDLLFQNLVAKIIGTKRGQLIRPDLVKKYGK